MMNDACIRPAIRSRGAAAAHAESFSGTGLVRRRIFHQLKTRRRPEQFIGQLGCLDFVGFDSSGLATPGVEFDEPDQEQVLAEYLSEERSGLVIPRREFLAEVLRPGKGAEVRGEPQLQR